MFFSSATSSCYACFVCVLLISLCSSACVTTTNPNGSSCNICVDNANQFIKCSITICTNNNMCRDTLLTSNDCANNCCADDNGSSFCIKKVSIGLAIAIIVLAITIGIPTIIFLIIIFRSCLCKTRGTLPPTQIIKLSDYKCDQIGPYRINRDQTCAICLQTSTNMMTFCKHFYHPVCLRSWSTRKMICPVCVSEQINPVKIYCIDCYRQVKLDILSLPNESGVQSGETPFEKQKCQDCLNPQRELLDMITIEQDYDNIKEIAKPNFNAINSTQSLMSIAENVKM